MVQEEQQLQTWILTLMREDRERGAELLLEAYTPLLWSVCQRRLSDPEDVKECVDDVFTDFCLNPEKYDPEQTSLKNYLAMLADRRAISYYRKNLRRTEAENAAGAPAADAPDDLALELEEALNKLKPEDAQIIRMKYYDGMTYREIAQKMGISEDAVKKRGTRSLSKLAKWLIIGLVLASILAGCAYVVHRYFRYSKGVGLVWDEEMPVYQMVDMPEPIDANELTHELLSVSYSKETLVVWVAHTPYDSTMVDNKFMRFAQLYETCVAYANGIYPGEYLTGMDYMNRFRIPMPWEKVETDEDGRIHLQIQLIPNDSSAKELKQFYDHDADMSAITWDITLEEVEVVQDPAGLGHYLSTPQVDILITSDMESIAGTGEESTIISLYPQYKEEGLRLSNLISGWYEMREGFKSSTPTLTDAQGNTYSIFRITGPHSVDTVPLYNLCFPKVPPGEYTLNFPALCYEVPSEISTVTLTLPKENDISLSCDETLNLPFNTTLHISELTRSVSYKENVIFSIETWTDSKMGYELVQDSSTVWMYDIDYQVSGDDQLVLCGIMDDFMFYCMSESGLMALDVLTEMIAFGNFVDNAGIELRDGRGLGAPDLLAITVKGCCYMDTQSYSIPITIK